MGFDPTISSVKAGIQSGNIRVYGVQWAGEDTGPIPVTIRARKAGDVGWAKEVGVLVDRNGNIIEPPSIPVQNARPGTQYEVNAAYSLGVGPGLSALVTMPYNLMGNYYLVSDAAETICGSEPVFLFSKETFAVGATMYTDSELTTPANGAYISRKTYGPIYRLEDGVIGVETAVGCFNSISGRFGLGNSTNICKGGYEVLYTNAPDLVNLIGSRMYRDVALIQGVTGFTYLLNAANGTIYNIDSEVAEVYSEAGQCEDFYNLKVNNTAPERVIDMIAMGGRVYSDDIVPGEGLVSTHAGFTGPISVRLYGGGSCDSCDFSELKLIKNGVAKQTMKVKDGLYRFIEEPFVSSDEIIIELNNTIPKTTGSETFPA